MYIDFRKNIIQYGQKKKNKLCKKEKNIIKYYKIL